jgi:hypothetical protein
VQPDFREVWCWQCRQGLLTPHRTSATWRPVLQALGNAQQDFSLIRACTLRAVPENRVRNPRAPNRSPARAAPGSAEAGSAPGWAGQDVAPGSVGRQGGAAAATLERNVEVARGRRRGGGESRESPTGAALTQNRLPRVPVRRVRLPPSSSTVGPSGGARANAETPGLLFAGQLGCGPASGDGAPLVFGPRGTTPGVGTRSVIASVAIRRRLQR